MCVTLIGVKDYRLTLSERYRTGASDFNRVDRDILVIPEVIVEDYHQLAEAILKPAFDIIWQSAGLTGSMNYDENGNRKER